jgi:hypothetical protein
VHYLLIELRSWWGVHDAYVSPQVPSSLCRIMVLNQGHLSNLQIISKCSTITSLVSARKPSTCSTTTHPTRNPN